MQKLTMKAKLPGIGPNGERVSNAMNWSREKETICTYKVACLKSGKITVAVEARMYMGRSSSASTVYCSLWVNGDLYCSGSGKAGGYGYHKESAALAGAINSAGIELYGSNYATWHDVKPNYKKRAYIGGCGHSSIEMALKAIARAAGFKGQMAIL